MANLPRVCVIRAGASGITTIKALQDRGVPFDYFDKGDRQGGMRVFENVHRVPRIYGSLDINTSRQRTAFHEFPMP